MIRIIDKPGSCCRCRLLFLKLPQLLHLLNSNIAIKWLAVNSNRAEAEWMAMVEAAQVSSLAVAVSAFSQL